MVLINMLEYNKNGNDWKHTSTRVISTCIDKKDAELKMQSLKNFEGTQYRTEFSIQQL